jgi:LPS-assembly lipoprotein
MSQAVSSTSSFDTAPRRARAIGRRSLLAGLATALAAPLAGCGFRPLNLPPEPGEVGSDVAAQLAAIRLGRTYGRNGQIIHQALQRRLAPGKASATAARYELNVTLLPSYEAQGYRPTGAISRVRMVMNSNWTLQTLSVPPRQVATGTARAIDSYNVVDNEYFASVVSSEAAERRLVEQIAEDITTRLAILFRETPAA